MFKFFATKEWYKRTAASAEGCDVSAGKPVGLEPANPTPPEEPTTNEDGSLFKVPLTAIVNVEPHTNADRLELATVYGFQVIVQKGKYKPGNKIIYIPIDSLLPIWLETILFPEGSKITLHHHRVRQIRIRKLASQGMLVDPSDVVSKVNTDYLALEQDLAAILNIAKYEPPTPKFQQSTGPKPRDKKNCNPYFRTYNGINNLKWLPNLFKEGEDVVIQCKLHGSHIRWAKAPFSANTLWKKVLKFFNFTPKFECVYGSNRVELTNKRNYKGFYGEDVYGAVLSKLNVFDKIKDGEFWHAELIGPNIQKDYAYGHKEHHIVVFDIRIMQPDGT